jgi:hypothetical protein
MSRRCRSHGRFGKCSLPADHGELHAVQIGVDFWFAYRVAGSRSTSVGYGRFRKGVWCPA